MNLKRVGIKIIIGYKVKKAAAQTGMNKRLSGMI